MRLLELDLKAFGPFTGRRLDLSGGREGLHLVYGPNEAGKSSALRALKALLYGFPARSGDDFLHPYDQLRVGARLRLGDGSELALVRRKGRRSTLLAPGDEAPLDDALLDRCLSGVDESLFSSLFGLDHAALVEGGRELLAQRGDVGQALFAAGLGTRNLRAVLAGLDEEAAGLFLPRGVKPRINQAIAEHREARRRLAERSLSGREWDAKRREVEARRAGAAELAAELAARKAERNRLERIRRAQPRLAERRDLLASRAELAGTVPLAEGFGDRLRAAREALRAAALAGARAAAGLAELAREGEGLAVAGALLDQEETIAGLHQGIERYTKGVADRSRLLVERGELAAEAESLLDELRPGLTADEAGALRPALGQWLRIQQLGADRLALWRQHDQASKDQAAAEGELAALRGALAALPAPRDPAALRRRLAAARRRGDLDRVAAEAAAELAREEEELRLDLARLGLFRGAPEEAEALPVPSEETIRRVQDELGRLAARRAALAGQLAASRAELAVAEGRLEEIRRGGAVPTEEEMIAARTRRDEIWGALRGPLFAGLSGKKGAADPAAYERSVRQADDLADRLRREADRVQEQAQLLARQGEIRRALDDLEAEESAAAADEERLAAEWKALWAPCGIDPLPPREMHPGWTRRHEALRARAESARAARRRLAGLAAERGEHRAAIRRELAALGAEEIAERDGDESLEPLLAAGEERVRALEEATAARERLAADAREAEERLAAVQAAAAGAATARESWLQSWGEAVRDLGLDREALPSEAMRVVDSLRQAFASLADAEKLDRRIAGIDRDVASFRDAVRSLAVEIAPGLADRPAEQAARDLQALASAARRAADRRADLDRRTARLEEEARQAAAGRRAAEAELARLVVEAGCADEAGLDEAERRALRLAALDRDLARAERQLREDGEGRTLDELESEAAGVEADALPGEIDRLDREIAELTARSGDLREELGRTQEELSRMEGGGEDAAREAERAQETLAALREGVERYARLRLAAAVLKREIERYRAENQDPVLRRAEDLFGKLTLGRYAGLRTDFDDRDEPVLAALRPDGRRVRVEAMSEGTRDQLYLALRLATLERYLAHAEPLPFVVDDILVNFDDERSRATLEVLAELSRRTQVILFTHHARLRDLAGSLGVGAGANGGESAGVFVRELG